VSGKRTTSPLKGWQPQIVTDAVGGRNNGSRETSDDTRAASRMIGQASSTAKRHNSTCDYSFLDDMAASAAVQYPSGEAQYRGKVVDKMRFFFKIPRDCLIAKQALIQSHIFQGSNVDVENESKTIWCVCLKTFHGTD